MLSTTDRAAWELVRASGNWKWVDGAGFCNAPDWFFDQFSTDRGRVNADVNAQGPFGAPAGSEPMSDDPATLGAMLGLARELWGCQGAHATERNGTWRLWAHGDAHQAVALRVRCGSAPTEFAALCHGIAAAPKEST